jgi:hypothetical protein
MAFELDGMPTTSTVETSVCGLSWLVNHRAGELTVRELIILLFANVYLPFQGNN